MSLINDALKRATHSQPSGSMPPAITKEPMLPVAAHHAPGLPIYFVPVLLFIISGACFFLWKGWQSQGQKMAQSLAASPITVKAREPAPAATAEEVIAIPANRNFSVEDDPAPAAPSVAATVAMPEEPVKSAAGSFRLQGIFFRPSNPSAVINNKTVFIGDFIGRSQVKSIDRQSVTLEINGDSQVLSLR